MGGAKTTLPPCVSENPNGTASTEEHPILHLTPVRDTMHVGDGGDGVVSVVVVDVKT